MEDLVGLAVALFIWYVLAAFLVGCMVKLTQQTRLYLVLGGVLLAAILYGGVVYFPLSDIYFSPRFSDLRYVMSMFGLDRVWLGIGTVWSKEFYFMTILPVVAYEYYIQVSLKKSSTTDGELLKIFKKARYVFALAFLVGAFTSLVLILSGSRDPEAAGWDVFSLVVFCPVVVVTMLAWSGWRKLKLSKENGKVETQ